MLQKVVINKFLNTLECIYFGSLMVEMPDGVKRYFQGKQPGVNAKLVICDWRAIPSLSAKGDVGFAEAYRDGWLDTDNLTNLLILVLENISVLEGYIYGGLFFKLSSQLLYFFRLNTMRGSKRNIHAHYDIGNDFYSLWLDSSMTYSSGIFHSPEDSLEQAQYNKYDRILQRLDIKSGRLLEIGCGWGGFVEHALNKVDLSIKGITISDHQYKFAHHKLNNKAEIVQEDYRNQTGKYDYIVSIEMFEAVGERFWREYFAKVKSLIHSKSKAIIQTISIDNPYFDRYRKTGDMIRTFVFPGGMLPSPSRFKQEAETVGLRVTDEFSFGQDYSKTLMHWLLSFEKRLPEIKTLNFDERFIRIWRFYLSICIAGFLTKRLDVTQFEMECD